MTSLLPRKGKLLSSISHFCMLCSLRLHPHLVSRTATSSHRHRVKRSSDVPRLAKTVGIFCSS
jgi:hypothetical protein